jgi:hypothetical protein
MSSSIKFRCLDDSGDNIFLVDSLSGTRIISTNQSINSSSGSLVVYGGLSIDNSSNSVSSTRGGALTIRGGASFEKDVHIGGNLTVYGTQTQIVSQTVNVYDNLIVVNSSPITNRDAGILFQRYQIENDSGLGTIVNDDIPIFSDTIVSSTSNTAILNAGASSSDDEYVNYFIKITSGAGINQIRKISNYIGSSKTITVNTPWTIQPTVGTTFSLYNKIYASQYYKTDSDTFTLGYTTNENDIISINDWVGLDAGALRIFNTDQCLGLGSGGSLTALGGASISKDLYVGGDITVGNINATSITSSSVKMVNLTTGSFLTLSDFYLGSTHSLFTTQSTGNNQNELLLFREYTNANPDRIRLRGGALAFDTFSNTDGNRYTENIAMYINSSGSVGINTTNPEVTLDVNGTIRSSGGIVSLSDNTLGNLYTENGNIGINIKNPSYRLDVNGNTHFSGDLYIDGLISGGDSTSSTFSYLTLTSTDDSLNYSTGSLVVFGGITIQTSTDASSVTAGGSFSTPGGVSVAKRLFIGEGVVSDYNSNTIGSIFTTGGNVGIGTMSPNSNLHINVNSTGSLQFGPDNSDGAYLSGSSGNLSIYTGNNNTGSLVVQCLQNGNVGIGNSDPVFKLDVNGTFNATTVTGGELYITKSTIGNAVFTNISTNNLILTDCSTLGNLYITGGNIGINNTSPIHVFDALGSVYINSSHHIDNNNVTDVSGGCLNIAGAVVIGTSGVHFVPSGSGQPSVTTRSPGSKIILSPELSATDVDYSIGMENSNTWFSTPNSNCGFKWYQGVENVMSISSSGSVMCHSTTNASGIGTGGGLTVAGGTCITKDVWIGGSLFVGDQNISSIYGNVYVNSFNGTGVCTIGNISIGRSMSNTNYKITGNLKTTTDNTNVYTVSFKSLTTTTFDAVIYRIDSLGSGWTDPNLYLSWQITP